MQAKLVMLGIALLVPWVGTVGAIQELEPNDTFPQRLGALATAPETLVVQGMSEYEGDLDWYEFEVSGDARQTVRLAAESEVAWQIILYEADGKHIASGTDSLTRRLAPGTYRVRLQQARLGRDGYTLFLSNEIERESNDGLVEATPVGTVQSEPLTVFASIEPAGDVDFFSFVIPDGFSDGEGLHLLRIETPCPEGDTVLLLYAADEELGYLVPVARNDDSGNASWSRLYLRNPQPGTYAVRVHEFADNAEIPSYRVVITPLTIADAEPNNSLETAAALGSLEDGAPLVTTQFARPGDVDMFAFTLDEPRCIVIETTGAVREDAALCLLDEEGGEIGCDDGVAGAGSRLLRRLDAGRYVVSVRAADPEVEFDYTLVVRTTECPAEAAESEPNNTPASSDRLTLPFDASGEITPGDPDVYSFVLAADMWVTAETYGSEDGDTTLCLLSADGESIACDDDGGTGLWSSIRVRLGAGVYFVRVELYTGQDPVAYQLLVRKDE